MKKFWIALLSCLTFVCMICGIACSDSKGPMFNEGYLEEITLGDPIMLDEYIDESLTHDYTAILTCDETGQERDLKMLGQWTTDTPGMYTLTYTVKSGEYKGKATAKINVVVPKAKWTYSRPTLVYRGGDTMTFNQLKRSLNIVVNSYFDYDFFVKSVTCNGETTQFTDEKSYTFPEAGEYTFKFGVQTEDGQELTADQKITVRSQQILAEGAQEWMDTNGITTYDYTYISADGQVTLDAGYYSTIAKDNVSYLAFNGENEGGYKLENTYVMVEFTGKNLPQVAFGCEEVTPSFTDGKPGILFTNGITDNNGNSYYKSLLNNSRLTIFGWNKVSFPEFDNRGRMWATGSEADPNPLSLQALKEDHQYRYIVGFSAAATDSVTVRIILVDLTTCERVYDVAQALSTSSGMVNSSGTNKLELSETMLNNGKIVLYGRYGRMTTLDKVYMPITNVGNIYDLDVAAPMNSNYKAKCDIGTKASVVDFIDIPATDYEFKVIDPDGELVEINDGEFTYTKSGDYIIYFDPKQEGIRPSSVSVKVLFDVYGPFAEDFLEKQGLIIAVDDAGVDSTTDPKYVSEGTTSLINRTINGKYGTVRMYISRSFVDFVMLSHAVTGIQFDVYSVKELQYGLLDISNNVDIAEDCAGTLPAETWTTITITYDMMLKNHDMYKGQSYVLAFEFVAEKSMKALECVYIDNIKLLTSDKVKPSNVAKLVMENNNMTAYGYRKLTGDADGISVTLAEGRYAGDWNEIKEDNVSYVAFNGSYGAGSYVVADFTGKNVPQICFFADKVTSSLTDGLAGFYIHTGMLKKSGVEVSPHDGGRVTFFGPNKMQYRRPDNQGRVGPQHGYQTANPVNSPLSINGLEDGVHYRYVAGIKNAQAGKFTVELLLINLDTNTEVVYYETAISGSWITTSYLNGNIVMYGRYNIAITLDKVYPAYMGVTSAYNIDLVKNAIAQ